MPQAVEQVCYSRSQVNGKLKLTWTLTLIYMIGNVWSADFIARNPRGTSSHPQPANGRTALPWVCAGSLVWATNT
ncbi:uncharacterized protein BDV14DRAFT_158729 [Aspergillus stella-maris]|uniref:uncharacterized protein n=1 Tax=Aspergillus stella-maris TaxID=1810926 RepID=UPI003CCD2EA0